MRFASQIMSTKLLLCIDDHKSKGSPVFQASLACFKLKVVDNFIRERTQ
jgi:hypothetical protein